VRTIHRRESGFTLIEMLVVLTLVSILAGIATLTLGGSSSRAYVTSMQSDLRNLQIAQEAYIEQTFAETGSATYANTVSDLKLTLSNGVGIELLGDATGWAARATHERVPGTRCALYRGSISPLPPAADEGKVVCD